MASELLESWSERLRNLCMPQPPPHPQPRRKNIPTKSNSTNNQLRSRNRIKKPPLFFLLMFRLSNIFIVIRIISWHTILEYSGFIGKTAKNLAYVMYQKHANGMPLYRQEKDWANQGVTLSRAALANWIIRPSHEWLEPMYNTIKKHLITEPLIHADESVLQVLKEEGRKATTESRMCVYTSGRSPTPAVLFEYQPTRSGQHTQRFLEGFSGYLQTDYSDKINIPIFLTKHINRSVHIWFAA